MIAISVMVALIVLAVAGVLYNCVDLVTDRSWPTETTLED